MYHPAFSSEFGVGCWLLLLLPLLVVLNHTRLLLPSFPPPASPITRSSLLESSRCTSQSVCLSQDPRDMSFTTVLRRADVLAPLTGIGAFLVSRYQEQSDCTSHASCEMQQGVSRATNRLVFLGSGSSTGCPRPLCPLVFQSSRGEETTEIQALRESLRERCVVSNLASQGDPATNKNYRGNPSLVVAFQDANGRPKNVVIDVGKTFREHALRWLPRRGIQSIDGVILTHEHADATFGLDELRGFQKFVGNPYSGAVPMPVFLSKHCLDDLRVRFPWLFPVPKPVSTTKPEVKRHTATFAVSVFESFKPFAVEGLTVVPLPVMHGEDLVSYGFAFTVGTKNVVYLSDISRMLPETLEFIHKQLPPIDILVVDALLVDRPNPVHYNLEEAMELIKLLEPRQTFLVGMNCDAFPPHDKANEMLDTISEGNVQLAYDGLELIC